MLSATAILRALPLRAALLRSTHGYPTPWRGQRLATCSLVRGATFNRSSRALVIIRAAHTGKALEPKPKQTIWMKVKDVLDHYYNGFKLFFTDVRVSSGLLKIVANGEVLSRRQRRQLIRTTGDVFRLVPFLVFIIVPFMEFLLPVALKLFPNMLPSTFEHSDQREEKKLALLKVKIDMARFLQQTVEEMARSELRPKDDQAAPTVAEFADLVERIRNAGEEVAMHDIMRFSKMFEDTLTLDNLSRSQLAALCRMLGLNSYGTSNILRFQLRVRLRQLRADDHLIAQESVDSLTVAELQTACQERGMRSVGVTLQRLRTQLEQWLELNLQAGVPASMILLTRALYNMPEPDTQAMKETLSSLSGKLVSEAELILAEREGISVNKKKLAIIAEEERLIREELLEEARMESALREKEAKKAAAAAQAEMDQAVSGVDFVTADVGQQEQSARGEKKEMLQEEEVITKEDLATLADAVNMITADNAATPSKEDLEDLVEDRADFVQEVENKPASAATRRLGSRIEKMIRGLEQDLAKVEDGIDESLVKDVDGEKFTDSRKDVMTLENIIAVSKKALKAEDAELMEKIAKVLDQDKDGLVNVEEIRSVFALLEEEGSDVTPADIARVAQLVHTEAELEAETEAKERAEAKDK